MTYYIDDNDDVFSGSSSQFLAPVKSSSRKAAVRQINGRKSSSSLRGASSLAQTIEDDAANGRHSLAHELAVALMPEPSAGSKLLAEEFGIEYDEGAEGIDEQPVLPAINGGSLADELDPPAFDASTGAPSFTIQPPPDNDLAAHFGSRSMRKSPPKLPEQDAMALLARDLETTDKFLAHLRHLDTGVEPPLERVASDIIRRINETARDREGQIRELLECEREFRKIAGEVGGNDVLGQLDELEEVEGLSEQASAVETKPARLESLPLATLKEEPLWNDWETDPDMHHLGDGDEEDNERDQSLYAELESPTTPAHASFPQPPPVYGPPTAAKALPQLAHMRTLTTSLVSSLTAISEHAQVNGAATTEAGRKIRALKNKLGGWRTDWDSAERSRLRIERWEAGIEDEADGALVTSLRVGASRVDGRRIVEEHLRAFEVALADAGRKTQAIMAAS